MALTFCETAFPPALLFPFPCQYVKKIVAACSRQGFHSERLHPEEAAVRQLKLLVCLYYLYDYMWMFWHVLAAKFRHIQTKRDSLIFALSILLPMFVPRCRLGA